MMESLQLGFQILFSIVVLKFSFLALLGLALSFLQSDLLLASRLVSVRLLIRSLLCSGSPLNLAGLKPIMMVCDSSDIFYGGFANSLGIRSS